MMKLLIFLSVIISHELLATITQAMCTNFDYNHRFGPVRNQDSHGLCWAFASTALLEEQLCIANTQKCGQSLSVLDASRATWVMSRDENDEGGWVGEGLNNFYRQSNSQVCLETNAPYELAETWGCSLSSLFWGTDPIFCEHLRLFELYETYRPKVEATRCTPNQYGLPMNPNDMITFINLTARTLPYRYPEGNYVDALTTSETASDFIKKLLIPPQCLNNRISLPKKRAYERDFMGQTNSAKFTHLRNILNSGVSASASMCVSNYMDSVSSDDYNQDSCGQHAITITGMRWNNSNSTCEVYLRNSWGPDAYPHGWIEAEEFLATTNSFTHIGK